MTKTNVMRLLDAEKISYKTAEYEYDESDLSGNHAADACGIERERVFKTLVTKGCKGGYFVFCIPVNSELDLKKAAKACLEKSVELIPVKDLLNLTGYLRGGCSPISMKKQFPTFIDETAILFDEIAVSAGKRGCQVILNPEELIKYVSANEFDLTV
ncbi:MAG: Cys-tRNA(Pro) deacylase [Oscillospiraceae bacterium]